MVPSPQTTIAEVGTLWSAWNSTVPSMGLAAVMVRSFPFLVKVSPSPLKFHFERTPFLSVTVVLYCFVAVSYFRVKVSERPPFWFTKDGQSSSAFTFFSMSAIWL